MALVSHSLSNIKNKNNMYGCAFTLLLPNYVVRNMEVMEYFYLEIFPRWDNMYWELGIIHTPPTPSSLTASKKQEKKKKLNPE